MKPTAITVAFVLLAAVFITGCTRPTETITVRKVIPDSLKIEAADRLHQLMEAASVNSRGEDEDWDDFVKAAHQVVEDMYGMPTWGIYVAYGEFVPYDLCSPAQQKWIDEFLEDER